MDHHYPEDSSSHNVEPLSALSNDINDNGSHYNYLNEASAFPQPSRLSLDYPAPAYPQTPSNEHPAGSHQMTMQNHIQSLENQVYVRRSHVFRKKYTNTLFLCRLVFFTPSLFCS
jgi:hypothetical protein